MDNYWLKKDVFIDWQLHKDAVLGCFKDSKNITLLTKAIDLGEKLHAEPRLDGVGRANVHLLRVPRILFEEMGEREIETILIGVLHDVIEDTSYPEESIKKTLGRMYCMG